MLGNSLMTVTILLHGKGLVSENVVYNLFGLLFFASYFFLWGSLAIDGCLVQVMN